MWRMFPILVLMCGCSGPAHETNSEIQAALEQLNERVSADRAYCEAMGDIECSCLGQGFHPPQSCGSVPQPTETGLDVDGVPLSLISFRARLGQMIETHANACAQGNQTRCNAYDLLSPGMTDHDVQRLLLRTRRPLTDEERLYFNATRPSARRWVEMITPICDDGRAIACTQLSEHYRYGWGVYPDAQRAEEYRARACELEPTDRFCQPQ